jgi:LacI family transcriptional regulator
MPKRERITLKDVAAAAGVHVSTVSRALSPATRGRLRAEVARRIEKTADRLGYRRNLSAQSLRTSRSHAIGVIVTDIKNPMFPPMLAEMENVLGAKGYIPIAANLGDQPERQLTILDGLLARGIDGVILSSSFPPEALLAECRKADVPVVLTFGHLRGRGITSIANDDAVGSALAVEHLVSRGHRRIAHLAGPQTRSTGVARLRGFRQAIAAAALDAKRCPVEIAERYNRAAGAAACALLLAHRIRPSAIVAANDLLAVGCYDALRSAGLQCPRDVSVIGYGDHPLVDALQPPLTTIRVDHVEVARRAVDLLLGLIEERRLPQSLRLEPELIERGSVGAPRG